MSSSYTPQSSSPGQQWPFVDNTNTGNHMQLIATIAIVIVVILVSFHIYVRYRRRNHVVITIHSPSAATHPAAAVAGGLNAAAIASLPTFIHRVGSPANDCKEECAVCLSAAEEGEVMRLLPECKHVFHVECVDMWLHSHSTCPVCRTRARPVTKSEFGESLVAPPLPESFGHGGGGRAAQEGGSESSQVSGMGNGSRRWLTTADDGVVDLERQ